MDVKKAIQRGIEECKTMRNLWAGNHSFDQIKRVLEAMLDSKEQPEADANKKVEAENEFIGDVRDWAFAKYCDKCMTIQKFTPVKPEPDYKNRVVYLVKRRCAIYGIFLSPDVARKFSDYLDSNEKDERFKGVRGIIHMTTIGEFLEQEERSNHGKGVGDEK